VLTQEYKWKEIGKQCKEVCNGGGENGDVSARLNQMMYHQDLEDGQKTWVLVLGLAYLKVTNIAPSFSSYCEAHLNILHVYAFHYLLVFSHIL
jgi:hypothetical protein